MMKRKQKVKEVEAVGNWYEHSIKGKKKRNITLKTIKAYCKPNYIVLHESNALY
jgi:hypothetical protein